MVKNRSKTGVLILNLGTPDSPSVPDVRKYLREFLMDARVIDIPFLRRFFLINLIIAPFRAPQSARGYHELWTMDGSPLKVHGEGVVKLVQQALGQDYHVVLGMRYQNPSIRSALEQLKKRVVGRIIVFPLYPQYASASTGSSIAKFMEEIKTWEVVPTLKIISQFLEHPLFIKAFAEQGRKHMAKHKYDYFLFSYHGLPQRQILKASRGDYCRLGDCCSVYHAHNQYCYRAQCFETTRLLVKELGIREGQYKVCFQSRLGKTPWIKPYTDEVIRELVPQGIKNVLVFSPSFVADCLETTIEIGVEYKKRFMDSGGERWDLVESLNVSGAWIECLKHLVLEHA
ncbi:MAG: ferrochelatase [Candidatus Omnitrophica bacterium]|nr:ferrochelatase [Candidatus Omnitrophota bacterium]